MTLLSSSEDNMTLLSSSPSFVSPLKKHSLEMLTRTANVGDGRLEYSVDTGIPESLPWMP